MGQNVNSGFITADVQGEADSVPSPTGLTTEFLSESNSDETFTVPAGKVWVVVSAHVYSSGTGQTYIHLNDGTVRTLILSATANQNVSWNGAIKLTEGNTVKLNSASTSDTESFSYYESDA
jgi:hypothetical protein